MEITNDFELIVAMNMNGCIGSNNTIPWHLPEDLKHFRELTENNIVIMGRNTFESLPNGPLKNRLNIVISTRLDYTYNYPNVIISDMNHIFKIVQKYKNEYPKVFVIGGSQIYNLFINYCSKLHVTYVTYVMQFDLDACNNIYFNKSLLDDFNVVNTSDILISKNRLRYKFYTYERK